MSLEFASQMHIWYVLGTKTTVVFNIPIHFEIS